MSRPERPLDPTSSPVAAFAYDLRELRTRAGNPIYAAMSRRTGRSQAALAEAAGGKQFPSWETVEAYVMACGEDPNDWLDRWERTKEERGRKTTTILHEECTPLISEVEIAQVVNEVHPGVPNGSQVGNDAIPAGTSSFSAQLRPPRSRTIRIALASSLLFPATVIVGVWAAETAPHGTVRQSANNGVVTQPSRKRVVVEVQNMVAIGQSQLVEDSTAAFLTTRTVADCAQRNCITPDTRVLWSGAVLVATCQVQGDVMTNANESTAGILDNPGRVSSARWYWANTSNDQQGYIPEAWLAPGSRGGLGLPPCQERSISGSSPS